jgi:hypothetical protein
MSHKSDKITELHAESLQGVRLDLYDACGRRLERVMSSNLQTGEFVHIDSMGFERTSYAHAPLTLIHAATGCKIEYWQQLAVLYAFDRLAGRQRAKWNALKMKIEHGFNVAAKRSRMRLGSPRIHHAFDATIRGDHV